MPRALLSVYDKTAIESFATSLVNMGWELIASGGTRQALIDAGLPVQSVDEETGVPAMLGGRVKTLHPAIFAGILARDNESDRDDLDRMGYSRIDMVVCNLYPFQETISRAGTTLQDAIEEIDIGGVSLLRAAAKNFLYTTVICDPADYEAVTAEIQANNAVDLALRRSLAVKAFAHTRDYDTAIHAFLSRGTVNNTETTVELPAKLSIGMQKVEDLRYGENPHQGAAYYSQSSTDGPLGGKLLGGKQLSYNNILDLDAAWRAVSSFSDPSVVIVKHLNPCGIASAASIAQAYSPALESDPVSAFGGVIAVNRMVDLDFVETLGSLFVEAIAAPSFSSEAAEVLNEKRKNCRLLQIPFPFSGAEFELRKVQHGMLVQHADTGDPEGTLLRTVTERAPTTEEMSALQFAWKCVTHVKSNAIVLAIPSATVGIGGGLPSRVDAAQIAVAKAGERARGAVMASDAFFPFADGVKAAIDAGVTAIIQPGGSIRDAEVIEAANRADIAMVMTGIRHFRH